MASGADLLKAPNVRALHGIGTGPAWHDVGRIELDGRGVVLISAQGAALTLGPENFRLRAVRDNVGTCDGRTGGGQLARIDHQVGRIVLLPN